MPSPPLALLDALGTGPADIIGNSMGGAIALSLATARPDAVRRIVLMGSMGVAMALPAGLNTVWAYTPGVAQMREVIGLFAHDRGLITDELIELRYQASLSPAVRDSWAAMFPEPRQRWVDDLALSGAELAAIGVPVLLVHGRDDRVVPWRVSSAQLVDLLPDSRLHVLSGCGHWTMIEKTADFLAVVLPFLSVEIVARPGPSCRAVDAALRARGSPINIHVSGRRSHLVGVPAAGAWQRTRWRAERAERAPRTRTSRATGRPEEDSSATGHRRLGRPVSLALGHRPAPGRGTTPRNR